MLALVLFFFTYASLLIFPGIRAYLALGSAILFVLTGILPVTKLLGSIDWNVIMMIMGTMGLVSLFIQSRMPALIADRIIEHMPNVKWAVIALSLFAGLVSAFVDNVATVLMIAPIAITISQKLKISPVKAIIAISISSNLQGAATLVGDTTSILLSGYASLNFLDFFVYHDKPGIFWIVQLGALLSALVFLFIFRKDREPINSVENTEVEDFFPSLLLVATVSLLILNSFLPKQGISLWLSENSNGFICLGLLALGLVRDSIKKPQTFLKTLSDIDYFTLLLLAGLFVVIAGITEAGVVAWVGDFFIKLSGDNIFIMYTVIVWVSVFLSSFIDNIPYVATMLPVCYDIANKLGIDPSPLYFGLLVGATLGGNLTPIGASANITALGILRKAGYEVKARQFMKIGVPVTLVAVCSGYLLVWLNWTH